MTRVFKSGNNTQSPQPKNKSGFLRESKRRYNGKPKYKTRFSESFCDSNAHLFSLEAKSHLKTPSTMIRPSFRRKQGFFRYSSVVEDRDASSNWKPLESPQSVKKTAELESLIHSLASEVVEHDKRLRQWLQVDDASMKGFKRVHFQFPSATMNPEMETQEGNPKLHDSMSLRSFDCCSKNVGGEQPSDKDDFFPEEKLRMALANLSSSMESIESDRNALLSKIKSMEKEQDSQNEEGREQVVDPPQDITDVRQEMKVDVKDDERDALCTTRQSLESEIALLKRQHKEEIMDRNIQDEEIVSTMRMMKEYIAQLEKDTSRTTEDYQSQQANIAKAGNFVKEVKEKANDFKEIELTARVKDLEDENRKLNNSYSHQEQRKRLLEQENARLESQVEELQEEHELLDDSVALMIEDESKWKDRIQDLEDEREMWLSSSQGKSLPNDDIQEETRQDSGLEDEEMDSALNDVEARIEELEVELEHLKAKCTSQECLIVELLAGDKEQKEDDEKRYTKEEDRIKSIAPDVNEWKGKISGLQAEVDRSKALCHSQEEAFSKLVEQLQESLSTENDHSNAEFKNYIHQLESKRELMETELRELHAERDQLDSKCRSQECTMARLRSANGFMDPILEDEPYHEAVFYDDNEESSAVEEESASTFHEEMDKFNQNMVKKGHIRESAIAMLEEQNESKDANLEILEDVVKSFMKERGEQSPRRVMAARLKEKLAFRRNKSPQGNGDASSSGKPGVWC